MGGASFLIAKSAETKPHGEEEGREGRKEEKKKEMFKKKVVTATN